MVQKKGVYIKYKNQKYYTKDYNGSEKTKAVKGISILLSIKILKGTKK